MWPNPQETTDLVSFTEEVLNGKVHFFGAYIWPFSNSVYSILYPLEQSF